MATANGQRLLRAELARPRIGAWRADLECDAESALSGAVTIEIDGTTFSGFVVRSGIHGGRGRARVVGGAGGLSKELGAKNYTGAGLTVKAVLDDLLRECGEKLSSTADSATLGKVIAKWHRSKGPASHAIVAILDAAVAVWRVLRDGTIWVGVDTYPEANPTHTLIDEDWAAGIITIAPEAPDLDPGTTFRGQRVELVFHRLTGKELRTEAHLTSTATALRAFLGHIRRHIDYSRPYPCRVSGQNPDGTLQLVPDDDTMKGSGLDKVAIRRGLPGITKVEVPNGARCTLEFEAGDPDRPIVTAFEPGGVTLVAFDNGTKSITRVDDEVEITIPASTFLVAAQAGVLNPSPMTFTGKVNTGNDKLKA